MTITQWILLGIIIVILIAFLACIWIGNYFYNLALNPAVDKSVVLNAPHNAIDQGVVAKTVHEQWFEQSGAEDREMLSEDGLRLHAYVIRQANPASKWAILAHGYTSEARAMTYAAYQLHRRGFHILMPDARGHGLSEGKYIGMGWHERLDLVKWIHTLLAENPDVEIALYGVSMGAATVLMTSGEHLPPQVKVIVEDCGYTSAKAEFTYQLKGIFGLPAFPIIPIASLIARIRAGYTLGEADALSQIAKSDIPTMYIHGDQDTFVPSRMVHELYGAAKAEKELYIVPGAGHGGAASVAGEYYWNRVEGFIHRYIERTGA